MHGSNSTRGLLVVNPVIPPSVSLLNLYNELLPFCSQSDPEPHVLDLLHCARLSVRHRQDHRPQQEEERDPHSGRRAAALS